jgi:hypothetical protein
MSPYTYTHAYTRAEAIVDQVDVLFSEGGIDDDARARVCHAVEQRWLEAVAIFLTRGGKRVYEVEATINWTAHSDHAELSFSIDLPGWEGKGSPEAVILGRRVAKLAEDENLERSFWVRFTKAIRNDVARHKALCDRVGVIFRGGVPDWKNTPQTTSLPLQDLAEIDLSVRSAL